MAVFSGHLRLRAAPREPRGHGHGNSTTTLAEQSFRAPFHIGKSYWDGEVLQVRIINATAGILEGDELSLDAAVDPGGALLLTTPAASRAFVMKCGAASCRQRFAVGDRAWLEYAPEPLYPHADTQYAQDSELDLASTAECCWVESLAPGRVGRGEMWAWRRLQMTLTVRSAGRVLFRERLDASGPELARQAALFSYSEAWFATAVLQSAALRDPAWSSAVRELHSSGCAVAPTNLCSDLWLVRFVARGSLALKDTLAAFRARTAPYLPRLRSDLRRL